MDNTDNTVIDIDDVEKTNKTAPSVKLENIPDPLEIEKKDIANKIILLIQRNPLPKPIPATGFRTPDDLLNQASKAVPAKPPVYPSTTNVWPETTRRKSTRPVIFCPFCKKTDYIIDSLKNHMEARREVQCKECKLFFPNCFSLSKHIKGLRCRKQ